MLLKPARAAFVLIASAALITALSACTPAPPTEYTEEIRTNFISSCESQPGATTAMCGDCFDDVKEAFTIDEFIELDKALREGTASDADTEKLMSVLEGCA